MEYELFLWLKPDLSSDQIKKESKELEGLLSQDSPKTVKIENWGKKKLAYKIKSFREGNPLLCHFEANREKISDLKSTIARNENVIRYLITRLPMQNSKFKV